MTTRAINADAVCDAYVECALWSEDIDLGLDLAPETEAAMRADVMAFLGDATLGDALAFWAETLGDEQIGHDFWLTRNRHGAGFWDRFFGTGEGPRFGRILTEAALAYGESYLYAGDDRKVYVS